MLALNKPYAWLQSHAQLRGAWQRFAAEVTELIKALASPSSVIAEVEQMQALGAQADDQARDPELAASLRRRSARIGLR